MTALPERLKQAAQQLQLAALCGQLGGRREGGRAIKRARDKIRVVAALAQLHQRVVEPPNVPGALRVRRLGQRFLHAPTAHISGLEGLLLSCILVIATWSPGHASHSRQDALCAPVMPSCSAMDLLLAVVRKFAGGAYVGMWIGDQDKGAPAGAVRWP